MVERGVDGRISFCIESLGGECRGHAVGDGGSLLLHGPSVLGQGDNGLAGNHYL